MPTLERGAARTRTIETKTTEEVPLSGQGLGMPWDDYLRTLSPEDAELTTVKFFRVEPRGFDEGFIAKICPAIPVDEEWLGTHYGSGIYSAKIYSKTGKSHYERRIPVGASWGPPKGTPGTGVQTSTNGNGAGAASSQSSAIDAALNRLADIVERQNERMERMFDAQQRTPVAAPAAPSPIAEMGFKAALDVIAEATKTAMGMLVKPTETTASKLEELKLMKDILAPAAATAPAAQQGSMVEQVTQLGALIDIVEKIRGKGGDGVDWKAMLVEKGLDHIPELVDLGKTIMAGQNKQAEELRKREEARKASLDRIAQIQGNRPPVPEVPAASPAPSADATSVSPLNVVPINSVPASGPAAPEPVTEIPMAPISAESEKEMLDRFFKQRLVQLVTEGDEPASVLDWIDRTNPVYGAIISKASEKQMRHFLAGDSILAEITRLPNYEQFLRGLLDVIAADRKEDQSDEPLTGSPPPLKVN